MIPVLLSWFYLTVVTVGLGAAAQRTKLIEAVDVPKHSFLGLVILAAALQIWALFFTVGILCYSIFGLAGLMALMIARVRKPAVVQWPVVLLVGVVIMIVLRFSLLPLVDADSGVYHVQAVRWWNAHAVRGISNLNPRLGFNSAAHGITALVIAPFHKAPFGAFSSWLVLMLGCLAAAAMAQHGRAEPRVWYAVAVFVAALYFMRMDLCSPSPDVAVTVLGCAGAILLFAHDADRWLPALLWGAALVMKLSALPLIVGAASIVIPVYFARSIFAGLILLLPWLARSFIISGYLAFPVSQTAIADVDWRVPAATVAEQSGAIYAYPGSWLKSLTATHSYLLLLVACAIALIVVIGFRMRSVIPLVATCVVGFALLIVRAPDLRFGLPYLVPLAALPALKLPRARPIPNIVASVLAAALLFTATLPRYYTRPSAAGSSVVMETRAGSVRVYKAAGLCWDAPLPCVNQPTPVPHARGDDVRDGFKP